MKNIYIKLNKPELIYYKINNIKNNLIQIK